MTQDQHQHHRHHLVSWLEIALVKPVQVIKVILGSVRQLEVVPVFVRVLDGGVGPQGFDGRDDVRTEAETLLTVDILLDPGPNVETVNVLTNNNITTTTTTTTTTAQLLSRF